MLRMFGSSHSSNSCFKNQWPWFRSSHHWCSIKKGVLKNFAKFIGKHLWQSLFANKVAVFSSIFKNNFFTVAELRLSNTSLQSNKSSKWRSNKKGEYIDLKPEVNCFHKQLHTFVSTTQINELHRKPWRDNYLKWKMSEIIIWKFSWSDSSKYLVKNLEKIKNSRLEVVL